MWTPTEVAFSRSASHGSGRGGGGSEDEEELRWAALERLPTLKRVRRGLLRSSEGNYAVVDVTRLSSGDRTAVIDRLLGDSGDSEKFFRRIRRRFDAAGAEATKKVKELYADITTSNNQADSEEEGGAPAGD